MCLYNFTRHAELQFLLLCIVPSRLALYSHTLLWWKCFMLLLCPHFGFCALKMFMVGWGTRFTNLKFVLLKLHMNATYGHLWVLTSYCSSRCFLKIDVLVGVKVTCVAVVDTSTARTLFQYIQLLAVYFLRRGFCFALFCFKGTGEIIMGSK